MIVTIHDGEKEIGRAQVSNNVVLDDRGYVHLQDTDVYLKKGGTMTGFRVWADSGILMVVGHQLAQTFHRNTIIGLTDLNFNITPK